MMTIVVPTTVMVGIISGRMIRKKTWNSLAPSIRAASSNSVLMPFRPADKITMAKPTHIQMPTMMIINVGIWMWVGFAMVILSAGLKGISTELLEAARIDGANEFQVFFRIILPLMMPTITVVGTTIVIIALKTFDLVYVMTAGNYDTEVIANLFYQERFISRDAGTAAAVAVILLVAIVPIMLVNVRRFRSQEAMR